MFVVGLSALVTLAVLVPCKNHPFLALVVENRAQVLFLLAFFGLCIVRNIELSVLTGIQKLPKLTIVYLYNIDVLI